MNFQKSQWGAKDKISFTINIGLYLPETEKFHCNKETMDKFSEASSVVRKRIGDLMPKNHRDWFDVNPFIKKEDLYHEVKVLVEDLVLPYLDIVRSKQDILNFLLSGHKSDYMAAQIMTLYTNGFKAIARRQLNEELFKAQKGLPFYLENLKEIEHNMLD